MIRLLARNRWLDVLSRHSTVGFLGRDADPREIGAALGIRYLVQGTVAKHGDQVRITTDLVSAESGCHLWSETYDFGAGAHPEHSGVDGAADRCGHRVEVSVMGMERRGRVTRGGVGRSTGDRMNLSVSAEGGSLQ